MIAIRSVRFHLTLWYLVVLAAGMALFGTGSWLMLREFPARVRDGDRR
jgi:hypothetical protein